jgi:hypothetical protein
MDRHRQPVEGGPGEPVQVRSGHQLAGVDVVGGREEPVIGHQSRRVQDVVRRFDARPLVVLFRG